jgi:hypothetical protein
MSDANIQTPKISKREQNKLLKQQIKEQHKKEKQLKKEEKEKLKLEYKKQRKTYWNERRQTHNERHKQLNIEWTKKHPDYFKEKLHCDVCNKDYRRSSMPVHKLTLKHQRNLEVAISNNNN